MVILWAGKVLSFVILHQVLLKPSKVAGASEDVSWFHEYHKYKPTHYGKRFILAIPNSPIHQISISALFDTNVTITSASSQLWTTHIKAGKKIDYNVPDELRITSMGTNSKGLELNATNDIAVLVFLADSTPHADGFLALPINVLGMKYVIATSQRIDKAEFTVIAFHDNTTVNMEIRMSSGYFNYEEYSYRNGSTLTVTLDKLGTSDVHHDQDLSGTIITSNKPIAVISNCWHSRTLSSGNQDKLASFLLPGELWGKTFLLSTVGTTSIGDFFRVFALDSNTEVYRENTRIANLGRGQYYILDIRTVQTLFIYCSKPCQVIQYSITQSKSGSYTNAGPSMINLPSIDQFLPSYHVIFTGALKFKHSITLIIKQKEKNGLVINGAQMKSLSWTCQEYLGFCWTIVDISTEVNVTHSNRGVTFGLLVYGGANGVSYSYPGGFTFQKKLEFNEPCKRKVDLGFVLDSSGSVSVKNYQKMKTFVKDLTNYFSISRDETRVSVMSFSNDAKIHISFSQYFDIVRLSLAIEDIDYSGGGTATAIALNKAYQDMFQEKNGARKERVNKVLIILTDGQSNGGVEGPANKLKNAGVIIFSVGIGQNINLNELHTMASQPKDQRVILLEGFQELEALAKTMSSRTCNVSRFAVTCNKDSMSIAYERSTLPDYINIDELALQDRSCKAKSNKTHIFAETRLNGCGTSYRETQQELKFSNALTTDNIPSDGSIISRSKEVSLEFTCTYGRFRTVGSFNFLPAKQKLTVNEENVGNFTFTMDFYKDESYEQPYINDDYPVPKSISDQIYIQYSVDTSNTDIVVRAKTCRATPTNKPYDQPQYVFIDDGCDKDNTISHYTSGLKQLHQFSIQAFTFVINHRYVYFHCDLAICHKNTPNSVCTKSTSCPTRKRRDERSTDDGSKVYQLSAGPLIYRGKKDNTNSRGGGHGILVGSLLAVAAVAIVLISILGVLMIRRRLTPYETSSNVKVLSMDNTAATKE